MDEKMRAEEEARQKKAVTDAELLELRALLAALQKEHSLSDKENSRLLERLNDVEENLAEAERLHNKKMKELEEKYAKLNARNGDHLKNAHKMVLY